MFNNTRDKEYAVVSKSLLALEQRKKNDADIPRRWDRMT